MELDQSDKEVNAQIHVRQCFSVNLMQNKNLVTDVWSMKWYYSEISIKWIPSGPFQVSP